MTNTRIINTLPTDIRLLNYVQLYTQRVNTILARVNTYRKHNTFTENIQWIEDNTTLHITPDKYNKELVHIIDSKKQSNKVYEVELSIYYSTTNKILYVGDTVGIREYSKEDTEYKHPVIYGVRYTDISRVLEKYFTYITQ